MSFLPKAGVFPDILQEVEVPIVGNNRCRCTYSGITDNMICAGYASGGKDSCQVGILRGTSPKQEGPHFLIFLHRETLAAPW